jgi:hypothetical protein
MLVSLRSPALQWARLIFVFSSVEAIAFAAAGALFGVTVQHECVKSAEERADVNAKDAANGRALAALTIADDASDQPREPGYDEQSYGVPGSRPHDPGVGRRHAEAARRLFPELAAPQE